MDHIMTDLALKAYNSFDAALRSLLQTRMLACCLAGLKGKPADKRRSTYPGQAWYITSLIKFSLKSKSGQGLQYSTSYEGYRAHILGGLKHMQATSQECLSCFAEIFHDFLSGLSPAYPTMQHENIIIKTETLPPFMCSEAGLRPSL